MNFMRDYHTSVWEDLRYSFLPMFLLAGDDASLKAELFRSYSKGEYPSEAMVRRCVELGNKNTGSADSARLTFLTLTAESKNVTAFDLGFEMDILGLTVRKGEQKTATTTVAQPFEKKETPQYPPPKNPHPQSMSEIKKELHSLIP